MKRLNIRLISILVAASVVGGAAVYGIHRWQVNRHASGLLRRADLAEAEGETRKAIAHLSRYVQHRPNDHDAYARMALLQEASTQDRPLQRREFHATSGLLEKAIRQNPAHAELRQRTAEFYLRFGRAKDAIAHLQEVSDADQDAKTGMLLARAYVGAANLREAQRVLEAMVGYSATDDAFHIDRATGSDEVSAYTLLASIYRDERQNASLADRVMDACVQASPQSAAAYLARGQYRLRVSQTASDEIAKQLQAEGEADVRRAAELSPDDASVIAAIADVESFLGNLQEAEAWLQRGIRQHPDNDHMFRLQAQVALKQRRPQEAAEILRRGLEQRPGSLPLLLMLAEIDLSTGNLAGTRGAIAQLRTNERYRVLGDFLDAQVLLAERKWSDASRQIERLLPDLMAQRPDLGPQAYTSLAQCYERLGQTDRQREANRQLLALKPNSAVGHYSEARALARLGRPAEAQRQLAIAKRHAEQQGIELADLQKWEVALAAAQQSTTATTQNVTQELRERFLSEVSQRKDLTEEQKAAVRARFLMQQQEFTEAAEVIRAALTQSPDSKELLLAQVDLAQAQDGVDRAAELLSDLEAAHGDQVEFRLRRALLLTKDSSPEAASQLNALSQDLQGFNADEQFQLLRGLGGIFLNAGQSDRTQRLWREAAALQPDDLPIRLQLFELAVATGDVELTRFADTEIRNVAGEESAYAHFTRAHLRLAEAGQDATEQELNEVRQSLERATAIRPNWHALNLLRADLHLYDGNVPGAIEQLRLALENGPAAPPTVRRLVDLLWSQRRYDEAREAISRIGPQAAQSLDERMRSQFELAGGDLNSAIELAQEAARNSETPTDFIWLGRLHDRAGQAEQAIAAYRRAVQLEPASESARLLLLQSLLRADLQEEAESEVRRIALHVDPLRVDSTLGVAYQMLGEPLVALRHFEQAVHARPQDPATLRDLAAHHLLIKDVSSARKSIESLLKLSDVVGQESSHHIVWARRTKAHLIGNTGRYADYQLAVALLAENNASQAWASADLLLLTEITLPRGDPYALHDAINKFAAAVEARDLSSAERLAYGRLLDQAGSWDACHEVMSQLVAASPNNVALVTTWCEMQLKRGEVGNVETLLRDLDERDPAVKRVRARLFALTGRDDRAVELIRSLVPPSEAENRIAAVVSLARFLEELKLDDEAERYYRAAAQSRPELQLEVAAFLARNGRLNEALDLCDAQVSDRTIVAVSRIGIMGLTAARARINSEAPAVARVADWIAKGRRDMPDSKAMQLHYAYLNELQENHPTAIEVYEQYLSRSDLTFRERAIAANNVAMLLAVTGDCAEARRHIDEAIELLGPTAAMLDTLALVRLCSGDAESVERAIEELRLAWAVTGEPVIGLHLAWALSQTGDQAGAQATFRKAIAEGLNPPELSSLDRPKYDELAKLAKNASP